MGFEPIRRNCRPDTFRISPCDSGKITAGRDKRRPHRGVAFSFAARHSYMQRSRHRIIFWHPRGLIPAAIAFRATVVRATLWAGAFTNGVWDMLSVLVPLYAAALGLSASDIGFIVAARSVLPAVLSIHGGILMDHWGTPRVLLCVAIACCALPVAYPMTGWFAMLVVPHLLLGLASVWHVRFADGELQQPLTFATLARTAVFAHRHFLAPVMVGAIWDFFGAWPHSLRCPSVGGRRSRDCARRAPARPPAARRERWR